MRRLLLPCLLLPCLLLLPGCLAAKVAVLPVKAAGQVVETAVDAVTQTQQEADEDRGKALREEEERRKREESRQGRQAEPDTP